MTDATAILKDIDPRFLKSEEFQRLIESLDALRRTVEKTTPKPAQPKRTLTPYVDAPSILDCAWK